ncbi:MAG: hypothetical protein ACO3A2_05725, partial [Bdellovibrionia bacterium]
WVRRLRTLFAPLAAVEISQGREFLEQAQILFVDEKWTGEGGIDPNLGGIAELLKRSREKKQMILLLVRSAEKVPEVFLKGEVHGCLSLPFRALDLMNSLRGYEHWRSVEQISDWSASFSSSLQDLSQEVRLAEALQKKKMPRKFNHLKGLSVFSRYCAGMGSGGDYLDLQEGSRSLGQEPESSMRDPSAVSFVLSSASSYALSSAFLKAVMTLGDCNSPQEGRSAESSALVSEPWVSRILTELKPGMKPQDQLSLIHGVFLRTQGCLRLTHWGECGLFVAQPNGEFRVLAAQASALNPSSHPAQVKELQIPLAPAMRIALFSPGFLATCGGGKAVAQLLNRSRDEGAQESFNEWMFHFKSALPPEGGIPKHDSTAILIEIQKDFLPAIRLTQGETET